MIFYASTSSSSSSSIVMIQRGNQMDNQRGQEDRTILRTRITKEEQLLYFLQNEK